MAIKSILVTGANRGLGLEFIKQLTEVSTPPKFIFAACRNPDKAEDLKAIAKNHQNVKLIKIEVGDESSYKSAVAAVTELVGDQGLNVLFNIAGILPNIPFKKVTAEDMRSVYEVNTIGPLMITQSFYPLLKAAAAANPDLGISCSRAAVLNMTSGLGTIGNNTSGGFYPYRPSKAALNMVTKSMSVDFKLDSILAVSIDPGWVSTDMGGKNAKTTPTQCVSGIREAMEKMGQKENGMIVSWRGHTITEF